MINSAYDFTNIARNVASLKNIRNHKLECQYSSKKGDGFTGSVQAVTLSGTGENCNDQRLELVFKYSLRNKAAYESGPMRQVYLNEIKFYSEIVPRFQEFQKRHDIKDPFNNTPEYYGCIDEMYNECLALENIKYKSYDLWNSKQLMNENHLEMALKTFAKFHGTSLAMKSLEPESFEKITRHLKEVYIMSEFFNSSGYYNQIASTVSSLLSDLFDSITAQKYKEKLEFYRDNVAELTDKILRYHDEYDVILQGDCWSNNAMYQYEDLNNKLKPNNVILIDWQLTRCGPIVSDLSYFFYTIAPQESMDKLDHFLKIYHDTLSNHLKKFNLDVENLYSYKILYKQWQEMAKFGLFQSFTMRKMMLIESEAAPDIGENADSFLEKMELDDNKKNIFRGQMKGIIKHFVDRKFL